MRRGIWLPLHLVLAGAASTAIAAVMPFFAAAFAAAPPADPRLRVAAVAFVAAGAVGVSAGVTGAVTPLAVGGGLAFVSGALLTGAAATRPVYRGLGPGRGLVSSAYLVAVIDVAVGATLATLYLASWEPLVTGWPGGRVAHAWLNAIGFVSLVITATLLHFFPTVVGSRIQDRLDARLAVLGLGAGVPAVALGAIVDAPLTAAVGAAALVLGAAGLSSYAAAIWRSRGRWTTDQGWHRFAIGGLLSAIAWFDIVVIVAAGRTIAFGPVDGWSAVAVAAPLAVGWVGLAIVASATHLLPSVGPGDPPAHARQRRLLGRGATVRLVAANAGAALLAIGLPLPSAPLAAAGLALVTIGIGGTIALLVGAVATGSARRS